MTIIGLPMSAQQTDNFVVDHGSADVGVCAMSEIADPQSKPTTRRDEEADKQAFAQVEKWMAMIRQIDQERAAQTKRDR
jgi:hypothetical protein